MIIQLCALSKKYLYECDAIVRIHSNNTKKRSEADVQIQALSSHMNYVDMNGICIVKVEKPLIAYELMMDSNRNLND